MAKIQTFTLVGSNLAPGDDWTSSPRWRHSSSRTWNPNIPELPSNEFPENLPKWFSLIQTMKKSNELTFPKCLAKNLIHSSKLRESLPKATTRSKQKKSKMKLDALFHEIFLWWVVDKFNFLNSVNFELCTEAFCDMTLTNEITPFPREISICYCKTCIFVFIIMLFYEKKSLLW